MDQNLEGPETEEVEGRDLLHEWIRVPTVEFLRVCCLSVNRVESAIVSDDASICKREASLRRSGPGSWVSRPLQRTIAKDL